MAVDCDDSNFYMVNKRNVSSYYDIGVIKNGSLVFASNTGSNNDYGYEIEIGESGNVYLLGNHDVDGTVFYKINSGNSQVWRKTFTNANLGKYSRLHYNGATLDVIDYENNKWRTIDTSGNVTASADYTFDNCTFDYGYSMSVTNGNFWTLTSNNNGCMVTGF